MNDSPGLLGKIDATGVPLAAARLAVGAAMIYYGLAKISQPVLFLKEVHVYGILPSQPPLLLNLVAAMMPWTELVLGMFLLLGVLIRGASGLLVLMLVVFTAAIAHRALGVQQAGNIAFCAVEFDCGCGSGAVNICRKLVFNSALILLALVAFLSNSRRFCLSRLLRGWPGERAP